MGHRALYLTNKQLCTRRSKTDRAVCLLFALMFLEQRGFCLLTERERERHSPSMYRKCHTTPFTFIFQQVNSSAHTFQPYKSHRQESPPPRLTPAVFTSPSNVLLYIPLQLFGDYVHPSVDGDITFTIVATDKRFGMVNRPNIKDQKGILIEAIPLCLLLNKSHWFLSYNKTNQMHKFLKFIFGIKLYMVRTVPLSIIRSFSLACEQDQVPS